MKLYMPYTKIIVKASHWMSRDDTPPQKKNKIAVSRQEVHTVGKKRKVSNKINRNVATNQPHLNFWGNGGGYNF